jgi:hypothetical protein
VVSRSLFRDHQVAIRESGRPHPRHVGSASAGLLDEGRATSRSRRGTPVPHTERIAVLPEGLGSRLDLIIVWLDANCGADGWTSTPSSTGGVVNDALAICFADATLASAFVARWCAMQRVEIVDGVYQVREDEPTQRINAALHRTP